MVINNIQPPIFKEIKKIIDQQIFNTKKDPNKLVLNTIFQIIQSNPFISNPSNPPSTNQPIKFPNKLFINNYDTEAVVETSDIRKSDEHARVVLSFDNLDVDLPPTLKQECKANSAKHENKLFAILSKVEGDPKIEGRGIYHEAGSNRFVYVKGAGNRYSLDNGNSGSVRAAFGKGSDLFFDRITAKGSSHPRVYGTETVLWGGLEFVTAATIFAELAKEFNIQSLEQARTMGLTIPIGVSKFEKLSSEISIDINQFADDISDVEAQEKARWYGNFMGLGTVALEVPSNSRMQGSPFTSLDSFKDENQIKRTGSDNIKTLARTLRTLLKQGYVYSYSSSHLQNIYVAPRSECAQADSSDILHLGLIPDDILAKAKTAGKTKEDLQIEIITQQLLRGFTYADNDKVLLLASKEDKAELRSARAELIRELFGKSHNISEEQSQVFADLVEVDSYSIAKALARSLHNEFSNPEWNKAADRFNRALISAGHIVDVKSEYLQRWRRFGNNAIEILDSNSNHSASNILISMIEGILSGKDTNGDITTFLKSHVQAKEDKIERKSSLALPSIISSPINNKIILNKPLKLAISNFPQNIIKKNI